MAIENPKIPCEIGALQAICIIANIQLATRHPKNTGSSRKIAEQFARDLQKKVITIFPDQEVVLEMGWNPDFDI